MSRRRRRAERVEEYVYLDHGRLETYVNQLRAPVTYDKVPVWSAALSFPGPSAKAEQSRVQRDYTPFEQIAFLEERLRENGQLADDRWSGSKPVDVDDATFRLEACLARRAIFSHPDSGEELGVWVSRYDPLEQVGRAKTLILFEGVRSSDQRPQYLSSYSWLLLLVQQAARIDTALGKTLALRLQGEDSEINDIATSLEEDLAKNPIGFFEDLGADVFPERSIRTLYRVRSAALTAAGAIYEAATTLGYPIYVAESSRDTVAGDLSLYANDAVRIEMSEEEIQQAVDEALRAVRQSPPDGHSQPSSSA